MSDPTIDLLRRLDPTAGDDPAQAVSTDSRTDMLTRVMQADAAEVTTDAVVPATAAGRGSGRQFLVRRRLLPALVAAGLLAATTLSVVGLPGGSQQQAMGSALSFSDEGNFLRVKIVDPKADSARYNAEFKKRNLDITLELLPSSPSAVGKQVSSTLSEGSEPIRSTGDPEGCVQAYTYPCVPTFLVPKDYQGSTSFQIGRAAGPGEEIKAGGAIDGRGEALEGVKFQGRTVAQVLAILAQRGYTVPEYRVGINGVSTAQTKVPLTWFVKDGSLIKDKEVMLFASAKR